MTTASAASPRRSRDARLRTGFVDWVRGPHRWGVIVPVLLYLVLSLSGANQSSIGVSMLREDPAHPTGTILGEPLGVRSDEYLTSTPIDVGVTAAETTATLNPLTAQQTFFTQLPAGPVSGVVLLDGTLLTVPGVPDEILVAARWWLPFLLLFLGAPRWFALATGNARIGYFAAAMIALAPATAWWSFAQVRILGFTIAGCAVLLATRHAWLEDRRWKAVGLGVLAAVLLARTPLYYQPWAIVLVSTIVLATAVGMVAPRAGRRRSLTALLGVGGLTALLLGAIVWENRAGLLASLGTTYPGRRVSTGTANGIQDIFGGTNFFGLEGYDDFLSTNASEISSAFAVTFVWALILLAGRLRFVSTLHEVTTWTTAAITTCWFAWSMVEFGSWGARIPIVNLVPSGRAADVLGYLGVVLLCLVIPALPRRPGIRVAAVCAAVVAGLAAYAGTVLRVQNIPAIPVSLIWVSAALLAVVVFLVTWKPRAVYGYALAIVLSAVLVWDVNPLMFGLGDLRDSATAQRMLAEGTRAREEGEVWASDTPNVDTLMIATGVPALSGRQMSGPDEEGWRALDPEGRYEEMWNRGGAYIWFSWTDDEVTMSNPGVDVIKVAGSPCAVAELEPRLTHVVASSEIQGSCLTSEGTITWGGVDHWVYSIS
ncbi:DUF7657 domain-containing protein [Oerskovia jenensis]|uniref:DUF7657 domain-containing protein n=1 Tax=Oerskovia jenensis TaxID=162169 RepID=UPI0036DECD0B